MNSRLYSYLVAGFVFSLFSGYCMGQAAADTMLQSDDFSSDAQKADFVAYQPETAYSVVADGVNVENDQLRIDTLGIVVTPRVFDISGGPVIMKFKLAG